jgi:hypothetical protein
MEAPMTFWVYENWTHRRARVHKATCGCCKNGTGVHDQDSGRNGKWHGPYGDGDMALAGAQLLAQRDTALCGNCHR